MQIKCDKCAGTGWHDDKKQLVCRKCHGRGKIRAADAESDFLDEPWDERDPLDDDDDLDRLLRNAG